MTFSLEESSARSAAGDCSSFEVVAAIRGAPADEIRYPEFIKRSTAAGVIACWAFLAGRKVVYFGREGEMHIEQFPSSKSWL